jgi:hypothetical protein
VKRSNAKVIGEYGPFPGIDKVGGATCDGELRYGTWEGDESDARHIDPTTGDVLESRDVNSASSVRSYDP